MPRGSGGSLPTGASRPGPERPGAPGAPARAATADSGRHADVALAVDERIALLGVPVETHESQEAARQQRMRGRQCDPAVREHMIAAWRQVVDAILALVVGCGPSHTHEVAAVLLVCRLHGGHGAAASGDALLIYHAAANRAAGLERDFDALPLFAIA